jgi:membrane-bound inhibitor of C-type lysozyme
LTIPKVGDTFTTPMGISERFPGREMRVNWVAPDGRAIDAYPVESQEGDKYCHSTYYVDNKGCILFVTDTDSERQETQEQEDVARAYVIAANSSA